jgi:hypothetical protein
MLLVLITRRPSRTHLVGSIDNEYVGTAFFLGLFSYHIAAGESGPGRDLAMTSTRARNVDQGLLVTGECVLMNQMRVNQ